MLGLEVINVLGTHVVFSSLCILFVGRLIASWEMMLDDANGMRVQFGSSGWRMGSLASMGLSHLDRRFSGGVVWITGTVFG